MITTVDLLLAVAFGFAISIGAHYTGACMGMPYAAGAIRSNSALLLMAPLAFLGALLASHGVEATVGHGILESPTVALGIALAIVASALALTSAYNFLTVPTSTIQILVFSTVGAGFAAGLRIDSGTVATLLGLWAAAPVAAFALGFGLLRLSDRWLPTSGRGARLARPTATALVGVGAAASFAMGANDVANASGALVMTGALGLFAAAGLGGLGLAVGVLSWGRPILRRVAFDIVRLDPRMATVSQLAQSLVILTSVAFGYFTSMNQALVGAMLGAGVARHQAGILGAPVRQILVGWAIGPFSGFALGYLLTVLALHFPAA